MTSARTAKEARRTTPTPASSVHCTRGLRPAINGTTAGLRSALVMLCNHSQSLYKAVSPVSKSEENDGGELSLGKHFARDCRSARRTTRATQTAPESSCERNSAVPCGAPKKKSHSHTSLSLILLSCLHPTHDSQPRRSGLPGQPVSHSRLALSYNRNRLWRKHKDSKAGVAI